MKNHQQARLTAALMMTNNLSDQLQLQSSSSSSTMQSSIASSWSGCHINWRSCYFERPWVTDVPQQSSHKAVGGSGKSIVNALFRSLGGMKNSQSSSQQMGALGKKPRCSFKCPQQTKKISKFFVDSVIEKLVVATIPPYFTKKYHATVQGVVEFWDPVCFKQSLVSRSQAF